MEPVHDMDPTGGVGTIRRLLRVPIVDAFADLFTVPDDRLVL